MSYNRLLLDKDREEERYTKIIEVMWRMFPDMMSRKFPRANIQQAFVADTVIKLRENFDHNVKVLSVGSYEDTAYEFLKSTNHRILGIDPTTDVDLHTYTKIQYHNFFDIVFSTSVLEHVSDDQQFLSDTCRLINYEGYGILTMDFNNNYMSGDILPYTDVRFYTERDMARLISILDKFDCKLIDSPDWNGTPDFEYDGCTYAFATFVFQKGKERVWVA